jgi:hypothetical protein
MDHALQIGIDEELRRRADWGIVEDHARRQMVIQMRHTIYGKPHPEVHVIRFPSDWWQAVKERFAPAWFRDRWPVKFTSVMASLEELYPNIRPELPDHGPVFRFRVHKREEFPVW